MQKNLKNEAINKRMTVDVLGKNDQTGKSCHTLFCRICPVTPFFISFSNALQSFLTQKVKENRQSRKALLRPDVLNECSQRPYYVRTSSMNVLKGPITSGRPQWMFSKALLRPDILNECSQRPYYVRTSSMNVLKGPITSGRPQWMFSCADDDTCRSNIRWPSVSNERNYTSCKDRDTRSIQFKLTSHSVHTIMCQTRFNVADVQLILMRIILKW